MVIDNELPPGCRTIFSHVRIRLEAEQMASLIRTWSGRGPRDGVSVDIRGSSLYSFA